MVIIYGSNWQPHLEILGCVITGIVAFLMYSAKQLLLLLCSGDVYRCTRDALAGQGDWKLVLPSLALHWLVFGYAMKNSGLYWRR